MKRTLPRYIFLLAFQLFFIGTAFANAYDFPLTEENEWIEEAVKIRLDSLKGSIIVYSNNSTVRSYIKRYVYYQRDYAERLLGLTTIYFPLFEKYLDKHDMPESLKCLPIIESALDPHAVSWVGAGGLWQFMPATAEESGLKIDEYIDERSDPNKSTEAALLYLKKQYERFGDWALAISAYNCGPGRVNRAIKRARSKNYWRLRRYLPRETRKYVPKFIAACYLMKFHRDHNMEPTFPLLDLQLTQNVVIYEFLDFFRIAQITGLPLDLIKALNPAYKKSFIPEDKKGNFICLPKRAASALNDYLNHKNTREHMETAEQFTRPVYASKFIDESSEYIQSTYIVPDTQHITALAELFDVTEHALKSWNGILDTLIAAGDTLTLYQPRQFLRFQPIITKGLVGAIPKLAPVEFYRHTPAPRAIEAIFYLYSVKKKESFSKIAEKLPDTNLEELLALNDKRKDKKLKRGTAIKVRIP